MTYREKIRTVDSDMIHEECCIGGVHGCPGDYFKEAPTLAHNCCNVCDRVCRDCWDQEMPSTKEPSDKKPSETVLEWLDRIVERNDKSINIFISPDGSISINVYPEKEAEGEK